MEHLISQWTMTLWYGWCAPNNKPVFSSNNQATTITPRFIECFVDTKTVVKQVTTMKLNIDFLKQFSYFFNSKKIYHNFNLSINQTSTPMWSISKNGHWGGAVREQNPTIDWIIISRYRLGILILIWVCKISAKISLELITTKSSFLRSFH